MLIGKLQGTIVGGGTLEAYEYQDQSSAEVAIGRISPGYYGAQVAAASLTEEVSSLHFYRGDRLLGLYTRAQMLV